MNPESITFRAAFPSIMSAILITGNREGMRIKLDIPESEMASAANLLLWRERVLVVTVIPENVRHRKYEAEKGTEGSSPTMDSRRTKIRRNKRAGG